MARLDIIGPLYPYTENDSRLIAQKMAAIDPKEELDVFFHSPGGSVWEGKAIFNLLMQHEGNVKGHVILAMSAASFAAMGCDELIVSDLSEFMIHSAMTVELFAGNAVEIDPFIDYLKKQKSELELEDKAIASIYARRASIDVAQVTKWMAETTTWRGKAIAKAGFATKFEAIPARDKQNFMNFDLRCYKGGTESKWHKTFDESIRPQDSWVVSATQGTAMNNSADPPAADPEKIREIAKNQAAARARTLAIKHPTAV